MRTTTAAAVALFVATAAAPANADDKAACLDAASKGQKLRAAHSLVAAREQLRICAAAICPAAISSDCTGWLADVESALPTVVVTAKGSSGSDLVDVQVSVDGKPLLTKLDGRAVPMDPGAHTFHFAGADGATLDRQVLVREGEKNQEVAVILEASVAAPAPLQPTSEPTPAPPPPPADSGTASSSGPPWKTIGWIVGGAGLVGLGVGAVFGVVALHDKSNAGCNDANVCQPGSTSSIRSAALASDISWITGAVLLAGGAALVLFAPDGHAKAATAVRVAPTLVVGGGGAMVGGAW